MKTPLFDVNKFAKVLPLYYLFFVLLFLFIYVVVSGTAVLTSWQDTDSANAATNEHQVSRTICVPAPPCERNAFLCWFWRAFRPNRCFVVPPESAVVSPSPEPSVSATPSFTPTACVPRPPCIDAPKYRCLLPEPEEGWCPAPSTSPRPIPSLSPIPLPTDSVVATPGGGCSVPPNCKKGMCPDVCISNF